MSNFHTTLFQNLTFEIPPLWFFRVVEGLNKIVTSPCGLIWLRFDFQIYFLHFNAHFDVMNCVGSKTEILRKKSPCEG
jgi:hypothetical protein